VEEVEKMEIVWGKGGGRDSEKAREIERKQME